MTEPINFDKEQCLKWLDNININPISGKELNITNDFPSKCDLVSFDEFDIKRRKL